MKRRLALLKLSAAGLALAVLGGCGFELRKDPELHFKTIALQGFNPNSGLAEELKRQLARSTAVLVQDVAKADVVLEARRDTQDKSVVVTTSAGQVREWQLHLQLDYIVLTPAGDVVLPLTELRMARELTYVESQAVAKEQEEAALYRAMQYDAAAQLMRRLAAVHLPG
ncbi:MAG: hypothetical protein JOY60_03820 [Burkholderiaceae bacterium]|nr:hypothetical protein [Burkholderiaceae bacterium]